MIKDVRDAEAPQISIRRRNDFDICADILRVAKGGAKKTRIVYQTNLNFKVVKGYLKSLMERGLLTFREPRYFATDKADSYIARYEALKHL